MRMLLTRPCQTSQTSKALIPKYYGSYSLDAPIPIPIDLSTKRCARLTLMELIPGSSMRNIDPRGLSQQARQQIMKSLIEIYTLAYSREIILVDTHPRNVMLTSSASGHAPAVFIDFGDALFGWAWRWPKRLGKPSKHLRLASFAVSWRPWPSTWVSRLDWLGLATLAWSRIWAHSSVNITTGARHFSSTSASERETSSQKLVSMMGAFVDNICGNMFNLLYSILFFYLLLSSSSIIKQYKFTPCNQRLCICDVRCDLHTLSVVIYTGYTKKMPRIHLRAGPGRLRRGHNLSLMHDRQW